MNTMHSKQPQLDECPACRGLGWVVRPPVAGDGLYDQMDGRGFFRSGVSLRDKMLPCRFCATDKRMAWLRDHSGLQPEEQGRRLADFQIVGAGDKRQAAQRVQARALIDQAIENHVGLFTFWGDFGSGKTLALQVAINELRDQAMTEGYYAPFSVIVDQLRQMFATRQDTTNYWDRLLSVPVLAVDEVSRFDEGRAWIRDRLFVLADTRYRMRNSHLTLFATNDDPRVALPTSDAVGYLFSRMREGQLCELRGDLRAVAKVRS